MAPIKGCDFELEFIQYTMTLTVNDSINNMLE